MKALFNSPFLAIQPIQIVLQQAKAKQSQLAMQKLQQKCAQSGLLSRAVKSSSIIFFPSHKAQKGMHTIFSSR